MQKMIRRKKCKKSFRSRKFKNTVVILTDCLDQLIQSLCFLKRNIIRLWHLAILNLLKIASICI